MRERVAETAKRRGEAALRVVIFSTLCHENKKGLESVCKVLSCVRRFIHRKYIYKSARDWESVFREANKSVRLLATRGKSKDTHGDVCRGVVVNGCWNARRRKIIEKWGLKMRALRDGHHLDVDPGVRSHHE